MNCTLHIKTLALLVTSLAVFSELVSDHQLYRSYRNILSLMTEFGIGCWEILKHFQTNFVKHRLRSSWELQNSLIAGSTAKLDCETEGNIWPEHLCGWVCTSVADHDGMDIRHVLAMPDFGPVSTLTNRSCTQLTFLETPLILSSLRQKEVTCKVLSSDGTSVTDS